MPCFKPLVATRKYTKDGRANGVQVLRAKRKTDLDLGEFAVPCGQCIGCRLDHSKMWAVRCIHEARMTRNNSFLTLTFNDEHMPWDWSLSVPTHQKFMKKLRNAVGPDVRFYMCGEYGEDRYHKVTGELEHFGRPHYHYLIFGYDFPDKTYWKTHRDHPYYRSEELEKLWPYGFSTVGNVTPETAAYTARYVLKKQTGDVAKEEKYTRDINGYGLVRVQEEFCRMSLRPGIGSSWFKKYGKSDVYDSGDFIVINGKKYSTPRYYDTLLERLDVASLVDIKSERRSRAEAYASNNTFERLLVREEIQQLKSEKLIRGYENGST